MEKTKTHATTSLLGQVNRGKLTFDLLEKT